jgi:hypothetical protein
MKAFTVGWSASMRRSTASTTATGEMAFVRICRARVSASVWIIARPVYLATTARRLLTAR